MVGMRLNLQVVSRSKTFSTTLIASAKTSYSVSLPTRMCDCWFGFSTIMMIVLKKESNLVRLP